MKHPRSVSGASPQGGAPSGAAEPVPREPAISVASCAHAWLEHADRNEKINFGRWIIWGLFALVLLTMPRLFSSSLAVSLLSQMGIAIIACLSYNMLLGQGGMLSFGHAVYSGLGAYMTIHALNMMSGLAKAGSPFVPVSLLPWRVGWLACSSPAFSAMSRPRRRARPSP